MLRIDATEEQLNSLFKELPKHLKNGWQMPTEKSLEERAFEENTVYQYSGNEFRHTYLHINKKLGAIILSPIGGEATISEAEGENLLNSFNEILKELGFSLTKLTGVLK